MGKHGAALGADLYELYDAGKHSLPAVADDLHAAWLKVPSSVSGATSRSGGLGADPGGVIDSLLDVVNSALSTSSRNLNETGEALVWIANQYAATDAAAAAEFNRKKQELGD